MAEEKTLETVKTEFSFKDHMHPETRKNLNELKCLKCESLILQAMKCELLENETCEEMPSIFKNKDPEVTNNNRWFWLATDIFTFENIGLTNAADNKKYLICADCELGPLGFQLLDKPNEFLLSADRVKYC